MPEKSPLWWRVFRSDLTYAVAFGLVLAFLFGWRSLHYQSSLLDRLPSWGWMIPVGLWLAFVGLLWHQRRRRNESAG